MWFLKSSHFQYTTIIPSFAGTGLFIGSLRMQLIDKLIFECKKTGYRAEIEFHGKVSDM